jgi:cation:H+ antiporter
MGTDVLFLVVGLVLLVGGGDALVRGASALARHFGISPLVVGLTVVAFGTSAPELFVNVIAVFEGKGELSFGNVIGSNIANIGLVIGLTALVRPVAMPAAIITREIPMMTLASLVALALAFDVVLGETPMDFLSQDGAALVGTPTDVLSQTGGDVLVGTPRDFFSRADGIVLLLLFCVFIYYTVSDALRHRGESLSAGQGGESRPLMPSVALTIVGFAGLAGGGYLTVDGASGVASALGVSDAVIGKTIVAVGTSLPELVTSLLSVIRKETDLAVGNAVGSNIFNLLFVLGVTGTLRPVPVPSGGHLDLMIATALAALLLPLSINPTRHVSRWSGGLLFGIYAGFMLYTGWRSL